MEAYNHLIMEASMKANQIKQSTLLCMIFNTVNKYKFNHGGVNESKPLSNLHLLMEASLKAI